MKSFFQDWAIFLGTMLLLLWTGMRPEWYHWLIVLIGGLIYGYKSFAEGFRFGHNTRATMTAEEFDKWLKSHNINPTDLAKHQRRN